MYPESLEVLRTISHEQRGYGWLRANGHQNAMTSGCLDPCAQQHDHFEENLREDAEHVYTK